MKYKYKINYGGSNFILKEKKEEKENINKFVKELDDILGTIKTHKSNYKDYKDSEFLKKLNDEYNVDSSKDNKINNILNNSELINYFDKLYNDDKQGQIYLEEKFKNVIQEKLDYLIPEIKNLYKKKYNLEYKKDYIIKEYLSENSKIIYLGDYHSSIHSLIEVIEYLQKEKILDDEYKLIDDYYIVFLGDIVDRGPYGIECLYIIYLLFYINNINKNKIFLLNGNHEEKIVYDNYGFNFEMENQFVEKTNGNYTKQILEEIIEYLPLALFIKKSNDNSKWYQFCHGGIDYKYQIYNPHLIFNFLNNNNNNNLLYLDYENNENIGFLWSDFGSNGISNPNYERPMYNNEEVEEVLKKFNIMTIISGHQDLTNYAFLLKNNSDDESNNYVLDEIYKNYKLYTFKTDQFINNYGFEEKKDGDYYNEIRTKFNIDKQKKESNEQKEESNEQKEELNSLFEKESNEQKEESNEQIFFTPFESYGGNINDKFVEKSYLINHQTISASVMSSAKISKGVKYSVLGILDLKEDISKIIYLNPN